MPCPTHPKKKKGRCKCGVYKCCPAPEHCVAKSCHPNYSEKRCPKHPKNRAGICSSCKLYKCCEPPDKCLDPICHKKFRNHRLAISKKKRLSENACLSLLSRETKQENKKRKYNDDFFSFQFSFDKLPYKKTNISATAFNTASDVRSATEYEHTITLQMPKNGFSSKNMRRSTYFKAKYIFTTNVEKIAARIIPDNPGMCYQFLERQHEKKELKACTNLIDLFLFGDNETSTFAATVLSSSFTNENLHIAITTRIEELPLSKTRRIKEGRKNFGRTKFSTHRCMFKDLLKGQPLRKRQYKHRLKPEQISTSIKYFQEQLPIIPGMTRNAKIDGHVFPNLPVHSLGGKSLTKLFRNYCTMFPMKKNRIGQTNFVKMGKLLCKRGEIRTGLSSYYVNVRDVGDVLCRMLVRLKEFNDYVGLASLGDVDYQKNLEKLKVDWENIVQFLSYEFRTHHVSINSPCAGHCARYALNKTSTCIHNHNVGVCMTCNRIPEYFKNIRLFLDHIFNQVQKEEQDTLCLEIQSMINATKKVFEEKVYTYMAHQVRAIAQFDKISEEMKTFTEKKGGLWLDHKQKVQPMRYREGQVEYFGKRGMSLLGFMLVRRIKNGDKKGLSYHYFDAVIDKYSSQDNMQVLGVLEAVCKLITREFPQLDEIMVVSDNASCLASHDNIPYVHKQINPNFPNLKITKWIYTEACTGKNRLDTHFSFLNLKMKSYVRDGNSILTESDIFKALSFDGGTAGGTALLLDGLKLKGSVLKGGKSFKATKTGVRETHEMNFENDFPRIYTISNITCCEQITARKLENFEPSELSTEILKLEKSPKEALFIPDQMIQENEQPSAETQNLKISQRSIAINSALQICNVDFGKQHHNTIEYVHDNNKQYPTNNIFPGWAIYPKQKRNKGTQMSYDTMVLLHSLFQRGNDDKSRRVTADRAMILVREEVACKDWLEQAMVTEAKIKAFFGLKSNAQKKLINKASRDKKPNGNRNGGAKEEGKDRYVGNGGAEDEQKDDDAENADLQFEEQLMQNLIEEVNIISDCNMVLEGSFVDEPDIA